MISNIAKTINEAEIVEKSPSFISDFKIWKEKAKDIIENYGDDKSIDKARKIMEKDALYLYSFETDRDDLEKQAVAHFRWQLSQLVNILKHIKEN